MSSATRLDTHLGVPIALFASGRGSNFDAIVAAVKAGRLNARILCVISDQADAPVLEKARTQKIPAWSLPRVPGDSRESHEKKILDALRAEKEFPRFAVLAGYMRVLTENFLEPFRSDRGYARVVNIHPSLLPAFPGRDSYAQAFRYGCKRAGVTVHLVDREVDSGPICAQESFSIESCRSVEEVERLGLALEHRLYPQTLEWVLPEKFEIENDSDGRRMRVRPS